MRQALLTIVLVLTGCPAIPMAVTRYTSNDLPPRGRRQYASLTDGLRRELVLQDATAACSVALANDSSAENGPACRCAHSSGENWIVNCRDWAGGDLAAEGGSDDACTTEVDAGAATPPTVDGGSQ